jgi:hypothetical protein
MTIERIGRGNRQSHPRSEAAAPQQLGHRSSTPQAAHTETPQSCVDPQCRTTLLGRE